ncbi:MAG: protein translocase subunit SecDF [Chitinophagales bacterium]|nr:protein translocase subunit SecDF [Chitinophagales bacterium]
MQGKGLIRFFLIVLALVCIYQLSFTWVASNVESDAAAYAEQSVTADLTGEDRVEFISEKKREYLAKKANETVYNLGIAKYNYDEVKERALKLGLDLQGGMSVVLEVSKYDLVKSLSNNPKNPKLNDALEQARIESGKGNGDLIDLFVSIYEQANPGSQLVSLFSSRDNSERLAATANNADVKTFLKEEAEKGVNSTYTKLKERIDKFGVSQPYITLQESTGRIIVELPGVDNPKQVRKLLQSTANLQFWQTYTIQDLSANLTAANEALRSVMEENKDTFSDGSSIIDTTTVNTTAFTEDTATQTEVIAQNSGDSNTLFGENTDTISDLDTTASQSGPLLNTVLLPPQSAGPVLGYVNVKDTAKLMEYLAMDVVVSTFPGDVRFMLSSGPIPTDKDLYELYAMKGKVDGNGPLLEGDVISNATQSFNPTNGSPEVSMTMKSDGAKAWRRITSENTGKFIAITLDNTVYSAPRVNEEIPNGRSVISGNFEVKDAQVLANILEVGKLPVPSRIVQEDIVGPSLGRQAISAGLISMIAGLVLVIFFMALYYSTAGLVSDIALFANIFFIFGILSSIGATLTLPGIAGLVLTMGMAVDANVIIYERIREELAKGKTMIKAIADGYSNSYSAIIDSQLTTLIIGIILSQFGVGPVKGFAVVLIIGILTSLFTSIFISRLILDNMVRKEKPIKYYTNFTKNAFKNVNFDFMGKRRIGYIFSLSITFIGLMFIFISGFDLGVDFKGGRTYTVKFDQPVDATEVRNHLFGTFDDKIQVKTFSGNDKLKITTSYKIEESFPETDSVVASTLYQNLTGFYSTDPSFSTWDAVYKESQMKVEPTIAQDIKKSAFIALGLALLAIFIYITIRFRRWQFALGGVMALLHDAVVVLSVFAIFKNIMPFTLEINEAFIAALLTVIGYSINDTVVVFDRIREYLRESKAGTIKEIFNLAINQTLSRTVITGGTTMLSILVLLLFGTENIQGFALAIFVGVAFGTYSSVFIASSLALELYGKKSHDKSADEVLRRK